MTPARSFWQRHRWLVLRRLSQLSVLGLFAGSGALAGWLGGVWVLKGNLTASRVLDTVPLTDPFVLAQSLAAGHLPQLTALLGAVIVAGFYLVVGGRVFCSWVCPVNLVTDCAGWSRRRLGLKGGRMPPRSLRRWLLGSVLLASAFSGSMVWELVNPVSLLHREILFGAGIGLVLGDAACYVLGTAWFVFQMQCELGYALSVCVYPFIALDLAKIVVSCIVGALLRKRLVQAGVLKLKEA